MSGLSRKIDAQTVRNQGRASDPAANAFVSAIAGSGKTYVLTQRVKRLLLGGTRPERILCLTFTKAAAANMSNRLLRDLGEWVAMDDERLRAALSSLAGRAARDIRPHELRFARGVFAKAIETPGGLKIQTIHAFCDALLHQFPFEAGVPASFGELDAASEAEFLTAALAHIMDAALGEPDGQIATALQTLSRLAGEDGLAKHIRRAIGFRAVVDEALPHLDEVAGLDRRLRQGLGISESETLVELHAEIVDKAALRESEWPALIAELRQVGGNSAHRGNDLEAALQAPAGAARASAYLAVFCKSDGAPYTQTYLVPKKLEQAAPRIADILKSELARLTQLNQRRWALETHDISLALTVLARAVIDDIERLKQRDSLLAFDDLIAAANRLLAGGSGDWVRWKLDQGIEHILVDEAQDTSAAQWDLVRRLSEEFFAGEGANDKSRTLFVVGDDKQSIFSFQGAAPALFDRERRRIGQQSRDAAIDFHDVALHLSFRSSAPVLRAVETVFGDLARVPQVTSDQVFPPHHCAKEGAPGGVEIWPIAERPEKDDINGWDNPLRNRETGDPQMVLARRLARHIADQIGRMEVEDQASLRPLKAGDVLILVRQRNSFFEKIIRALKQQGLPVAGADRLTLVEHMAVMDLMALGDAALLPEDDLTLACLMKSPLLGFSEEDLFELAHGRGKASLIDEWRRRANETPRWRTGLARFEAWREQAGSERPYEFFAGVLGRDGGRRAFLTRLGAEANDALAEFIAAALDFESRHVPSLQGFLAWMRDTQAVVKREMEQGRDEVRVMTVHNAKGLEAKFVILPETATIPRPSNDDRLLVNDSPQDGRPLLLWSGKKGQEPALVAEARARRERDMLAEYRRLLYVAMTRAEDHLLIAGYPSGTGKGPPAESWYTLIAERLLAYCEEERGEDGQTIAWHYPALANAAAAPAAAMAAADVKLAPAWLTAPPSPPPRQREIAAPSRLTTGAAAQSSRPPEATGLSARARGDVLHRLLQILPSLPSTRRQQAAIAYVDRQLGAAGDGLAGEALAVLSLPDMASLLSGDVLTEVPVAGDVVLASGRSLTLSGRIDLLAVKPGRIAILDYKSGEIPESGTPAAYATQMALYIALLRTRYPGWFIDAYLLWTKLPRLDLLSQADLNAALAALAAS